MKRLVLPMLILLALPAAALAQGDVKEPPKTGVHSITLPEVPVQLKEGKGKETTQKYCSICHSPDYIPMQPPFPQEKWAAIVNKMRKVYGAPVPDAAAQEIINYLGANYGPGK